MTVSEAGVLLFVVFLVLGVGTTALGSSPVTVSVSFSVTVTVTTAAVGVFFLLVFFFVLGVGIVDSSEFKRERTASMADCFLVGFAVSTKSAMICDCSSKTGGITTAFLRPRFLAGASSPVAAVFLVEALTGLWKARILAFMSLVKDESSSKKPSSM